MIYRNAKVYCDGNHYIAIPKSTAKYKPKPTKIDTKTNLRQEFEQLYKQNANLKKKEKLANIVAGMSDFFDSKEKAIGFVKENLERKNINKIVRMTRLFRKVHLQEWNYFVSFTYDDKKHNEESFKKKLSTCLRHQATRKGWKYIGVWERSPSNNRLHFHGIFYIPQGTMLGKLEQITDYDTTHHKRQTANQDSHFLKRFGRNDFKPITKQDVNQSVSYMLKYLEKSGEKLVFSRGLPTYFNSDIMQEDVITTIGQEDRKLLLFDSFSCWNDGEYIGEVSNETIKKMPKSN